MRSESAQAEELLRVEMQLEIQQRRCTYRLSVYDAIACAADQHDKKKKELVICLFFGMWRLHTERRRRPSTAVECQTEGISPSKYEAWSAAGFPELVTAGGTATAWGAALSGTSSLVSIEHFSKLSNRSSVSRGACHVDG